MRWLHRAAMEPSEGSTALSTRAEMLRATRPSSAAAATDCGALLGLLGLLGCQEDLCRSCMKHEARLCRKITPKEQCSVKHPHSFNDSMRS